MSSDQPEEKPQHQIESELISYYDAESANRDLLTTEGRRLSGRLRAISSILPKAPARVLDIGSGPGRDCEALIAVGIAVTAIDLSFENATRCVGHGARALVGTAGSLPFRSATFDAIWSMSVLMHVTDHAIAATLRELRRVLRPGGVAVLGTWGRSAGDTTRNEVDSDRNFFRRSDLEWKSLLISNLGDIEHYENWPYQWAEVRAL